ncbi:MAG: helix-hairpin-helix domain-containing protein [Candidatus Eisenbacteria bacterium]|nr:helix-hairpin-helix domain-containing protein [Candidatus Eisenbacteria bacterium]
MILPLAAFSLLIIEAISASPAGAIDEAESGMAMDAALVEPININRTTLDELMTIPGMTADLAQGLVQFRATHGPIRAWSELASAESDLPAGRLLAVRPWLFLGAAAAGNEVRASLARTKTPTRIRDDATLLLRSGWVAAAGRVRRTMSNGLQPQVEPSMSLRIRPRPGLAIHVGDMAPLEGLGLLLGLRGSFSGEPPIGRHPTNSPWTIGKPDDLERTAPTPGSRFLRGAVVDLGGRLTIGTFKYRAALAAASLGDSILPPPHWHWARFRVGARGDSAVGVAVQVAIWQQRPWSSLHLSAPFGAGVARLELARDADGAIRRALTLDVRDGRRLRAEFRHVGGHRSFVAPLGFDSERDPVSAALLSTGRNENREVTSLSLRARLTRHTAALGRLTGRLDPAASRRAWDRPIGAAELGIEVTRTPGLAMAFDVGLETRGAPGPSPLADPPERRYTGRLKAAWEGKRTRLRFDWSGRLDLERGAAGDDHRIRSARDLLVIRGRWRGPAGTWAGGGIARFDMPPSGSALVFEERAAGQNGSVTVHGRGRRWHLAAGIARGRIEAALFVSEEVSVLAAVERSAGVALRLAAGGSDW